MAAAVSGVFPVCLDQQQACAEDGEVQKKQVALMEKLRNKRSSQHRSWTDSLMKSIRTTVVDRKLQGDSTERNQVQKCLYTLQRAMKVISQQSLVERLETVARHQGLTFGVSGSDPPSISLQADMFHIDITLNKGGGVKEVKIAHQGDASVCHELTDILSRGDFPEFTSHLEGLQSIYGITGEKKLKSKIYLALQSLEKDLNDLAQFQSSISGVANYIHKSPLGILLPRTAGKPMKLIYFVSPYDLLDKKTMSAHPMTVEAITEHGLGRSVTVCLESGPSNKLQTMPLLSVTKNLPSFNGLTHANSANLPACFVLVLPQPIPVAMSVIQSIHNLTKLDMGKENCSQSLLSLILDSNSGGKMKNDQQLFVSLPDQHHRYFINGVSGGVLERPGVMLSRIPFSHPTHVPQILTLLRQQLLFNSLMASCVRPTAKKDSASSLVFELTVISLKQMMVVFEHPAHDTMMTVDIDMSDITNIKCHMLGCDQNHSLCSDDQASVILQRCLSLPVLLRSLVRKGRSQLEKLMAEAQALAEEQARRAQEAAQRAATQLRQQQQQARLPTNIPPKGRPPPPQPPPRQLTPTYTPTPSPITSNPPSVGDLRGMGAGMDLLSSSPPGYPAMVGGGGGVGDSQDKQNNPLLVNLLDSDRGLHGPGGATGATSQTSSMPVTESPMLSKLLEDNTSVATNITPISSIPAPLQQAKTKSKGRKRRSQSDLPAGRSPKHRISDSDASERYGSLDFESSSSPFDSSLGGAGNLAGFHHHPMGPAPPRPPSQGHMSGNVIDLTDEHMPESSLKKLVDFSMESMMPPKDIRPGGATPDSELHNLLNQQDQGTSPSTAGLKPNQMTGSKNENASTSPEGLLTGSGEVGKASLPDPAAVLHPRVRPPSRSSPPAALAAFLGHGPVPSGPPVKARRDVEVGVTPTPPGAGPFPQQADFPPASQPFSSMDAIGMGVSTGAVPRPKVVSSGSMTDLLDIKSTLPLGKKGGGATLKASPNMDCLSDKRGLFEKFDFTGQTAPNPSVTFTSSTIPPVPGGVVEGEDQATPKVKLKLHSFRTPHGKSQSLDSGVVQSPSSAGSKSSNSNTFDFRSDEEEDEPMPLNYVPSDRLAVYSSSPTRLQISSKGKPPTPVSTPESPPPVKPEKLKRKDKNSGNSKRKKDRDESRKERKKKKFDLDLYMPTGKEAVYRASTIEGDQKTGTKLKIRVSKEPISTPSPLKESSRMDLSSEKAGKLSERVNDVLKRRSSSSSLTVEKLVLQKQDFKEHGLAGMDSGRNRDTTQLYRSALAPAPKSSSLKAGGVGKGPVSSNNSPLSKADPKLAKATIRLEPLNISSSSTSSSVTVTPPVKTVSTGRRTSERSERSERRVQSMSTPTAVSTPTSGTLSLASILPNAPTASSVASLPPIPKRPKVSTVNSSTTTITTTATKTSSGITINSNKNSPINAGYNHSLNKLTPTSAMGGSRSGNNPVGTNILKSSPGMGFNKTGPPAGILKTSPNMASHKVQKNTGMPQGILKNSGNVSQVGTNALKASTAGNQGMQKGSGGSNQFNNYSRGPNSTNLTGGPQKLGVSGHGPAKNLPAQGSGAFKGAGAAGNMSRGMSSGSFQRGPAPPQGGALKSPGLGSQGETCGQNSGAAKGAQLGKPQGASATSSMQRGLSLAGTMSQANNSGAAAKPNSMPTANQGAGQKLPGNQVRSLSTGGCGSSPNNTGRPATNMRNNSTSGLVAGSRVAPPNHLPINRPSTAPSQKTMSGSSPRTPSHHSPSNPVGPRFPGQSPQHKGSGASPSSISQRSSSMQTPTQRSNSSSSTSSQSGSTPRSSSAPSQRPPSNSQPPRPASHSSGSSPTHRPASTPGLASETRSASSGSGQAPGYPGRPSSAGPRPGSSPVAGNSSTSNKVTSSPGQRHTSSPSGSRTSSPSSLGTRVGGTSSGVSPLASRPSPSSSLADPTPVQRHGASGSIAASRQNSMSGANPPAVLSRPSSTGGQGSGAVSKQTSGVGASSTVPGRSSAGATVSSTGAGSRQMSVSASPPVTTIARQTTTPASSVAAPLRPSPSSSASVSASTECPQLSAPAKNSTAPPVSRLGTSISSTGAFPQTSESGGGGGGGTTAWRQATNTSTRTATTMSAVAGSSSSVSVSSAASRQTNAQSCAASTSGRQSGLGGAAMPVTAPASAAIITSAQRTSSGSSSIVSEGVGGRGGMVGRTGANTGAGTKVVSAGLGATSKGASVSKVATTSTTWTEGKGAPTDVTRTTSSSGTVTVTATVGVKGETGCDVSFSTAANTSLNSSSVKSSVLSATSVKSSPSLSSSLSSSSSSAKSSSSLLSSSSSSNTAVSMAGSKSILAGAARGRKSSLSAIVDKLTTKMVASSGPGTDSGDNSGAGGGTSVTGTAVEVSVEKRRSAMEEGELEQRTGVKRSASMSGLSPPGGEKVQRLDSHGKSSSVSSSSSSGASSSTPFPAHTPPHPATSMSLQERRRSGSVGERSSPSLLREDAADIGLDLSLPKDKAKPETALSTTSTPMPPPRPESLGGVSPKEPLMARSGSPAVGAEKVLAGGNKFNGDSSKDKSRGESEVFKVPTPKPQAGEEEERGGGGGGGMCRSGSVSPVCNSTSRPLPAPASPLSDASSPGNDLVIDCGESPSLHNNRLANARAGLGTPVHPSPKRVTLLAGEGAGSVGASDSTSSAQPLGKASPCSSAGGTKSSPHASSSSSLLIKPSPGQPSPPDAAAPEASTNSPCEIDDDLMDVALMGFNAS